MNPIHYQNNKLFIEDLPLKQIAQEFGTPAYVYSQAALDLALSNYQKAFARLNPLLCYAVKANANLSILRYFAQAGLGFDIVSGGELLRVLLAGADPKKIVFSGVGKSAQEMELALDKGILCFNVESLNELNRLNSVAKKLGKQAPISLRINPDVDAHTHPYISTGLKDNKFGIAYDEAIDTYKQASNMPNIKIIGIDCHIGSQLMDPSPVLDAFDRLLHLIECLSQQGIQIEHIDIGGGIGIQYSDETPPDMLKFAESLEKRIINNKIKLIMEPGRSMVGNAGILLTKIEYLKKGEHKNFIIVDAAMNDLMRPSLYSAYHSIIAIEERHGIEPIKADIVGPICESSDFLGKDRNLAVQEGDFLAVMSCGAYASTMASNYNSRPRAVEIMINKSKATIIRKRENISELFANELECSNMDHRLSLSKT